MKLDSICALLACAAVLLTTPLFVLGQAASTARLTGQVLDSTGAAMPNVDLDLEDTATGTHRAATSNAEGFFTIDLLPPSTYRLTAKASGFSTAVLPQIPLQVNQTASLNITMKLGDLSQQVTISATAAALETQTSALGGVVEESTVKQLPLLLRDPTQLVTLVAGVTSDHRTEGASAPGSNLGGLSYQGRLSFEINGGFRSQAISMVDGVDVTIAAGSFLSTPIQPTSDITQEFKVQTTNVPAEFGRGAGVLNIVTKSGSNSFHGSAFEFLQNNDLDANNFFSNMAGQELPHLERNQFGFTVGGPIRKDKTFFFFDTEWLKQNNLFPISTQVPTAAQRNGDFSGIYSTNGTPITIYNPYSTITNPDGSVGRVQFPNNQIPASLLSGFTQNVLSYYPTPNNPGVLGPNGEYTGIGNYFISGSQVSSYDRTDIKVDNNFGEKHRLMGRFSRDHYTINAVNVFDNIASPTSLSTRNNLQPGYNAVLSWTWLLSNSLILTQSASWARIVDDSNSKSLGFDVSKLGGPYADGSIASYANQYTGGTTFPNINPTGYAPLGDGFGQNFTEPFSNYQYSAGIMKTVGRHTIKAGFQGILLQAADNTNKGFGGTFNGTGGFTCGPNPLTCSSYTGNPVADLLVNTVDSGSMSGGFSSLYSGKYLAGYVQDDIRVTSRLTLNLGLRYEVNTPFTERYNHEFQFNPTVPNPLGGMSGPNTGGAALNSYFQALTGTSLSGAIVFPNSTGASGRGITPTDWTNWSPRIGAAFRATDKLVLRGGFSKLYMLSPISPGPSSPGDGPFGATTNLISSIDGIHPNVSLDNPFPNGFQTPLYDSQGLSTLIGTSLNTGSTLGKTPYQYQWNIGFQYSLPAKTIVSIAYAGTRGHDLTCGFFYCGDQIPSALIQKYGSQVLSTVANPFYGIITNPLSALSQPTVQLGQLLKNWPAYTGVTYILPAYQGPKSDTFKSSYDSLQVQANKQYSHGLTVTTAFTWSKILTNSDSFEAGYLGPGNGYQNVNNYAGEKSLSSSDVPYRVSVGYVYDLPFGKGRTFGNNWSKPVDAIIGGWQVAGVTAFSAGYPLGINQTGQTTGAFGGGSRPDWVGNACYDNGTGRSRNDKINGWLNPAGFAHNPNFTFGDAPRTLPCLSDGVKNTDFSAIKFFRLTERVNLEFRSEFFNIFNRTRLGDPNTTFGSSSFGVITSTLNTPRVIQFGAKVSF
jgi:Carboxypeptidase regulatory-like domain